MTTFSVFHMTITVMEKMIVTTGLMKQTAVS